MGDEVLEEAVLRKVHRQPAGSEDRVGRADQTPEVDDLVGFLVAEEERQGGQPHRDAAQVEGHVVPDPAVQPDLADPHGPVGELVCEQHPGEEPRDGLRRCPAEPAGDHREERR